MAMQYDEFCKAYDLNQATPGSREDYRRYLQELAVFLAILGKPERRPGTFAG